MPGLSGFEVLDALRTDERTRGIPVVILTSKALDPDDHRRLDGKVTAHLSKGSPSREIACAALDFAPRHGGPRPRPPLAPRSCSSPTTAPAPRPAPHAPAPVPPAH